MSAPARDIDIGAALAGMVLAGELRDQAGAVLLPSGAALSEASLASLRRRGVASLRVFEPVDAAALEAQRQALQIRLERLFRRSPADAASDQLRERVLAYRTRTPG